MICLVGVACFMAGFAAFALLAAKLKGVCEGCGQGSDTFGVCNVCMDVITDTPEENDQAALTT